MPPTGFHGLLALFLAKRIDQENGETRLGLVFGSVFPDLDLIGSFLIYVFTQDKFLTIYFHRTITHSLIVMIGLFVIGILFWYQKTVDVKYKRFGFLILGFVTGMFLHTILDLFYLDGVTLLWPLQPIGDRVRIIPFTFEDLSPAYNNLLVKIIAALDGGFDSLYYFAFAYLASEYKTNKSLKINFSGKTIEIREWRSKLKKIAWFLILVCIVFIFLAFLSIPWPGLDRDNFIILLYIPLLPIYVFSGILPLIMKETVLKME